MGGVTSPSSLCGLNAVTTENLFVTNLLEVSIGRDFGALKCWLTFVIRTRNLEWLAAVRQVHRLRYFSSVRYEVTRTSGYKLEVKERDTPPPPAP